MIDVMDGDPGRRVCECRFAWTVDAPGIVRALLSFPAPYAAGVAHLSTAPGGSSLLRRRTAEGQWSVLEYVAHTRDAVAWYRGRIDRVLVEDHPRLTPFDWDAACEARRYADEDPAHAVRGLTGAMVTMADMLGRLDPASWRRVGIGTDGGTRRVLDLARRAAHEGHHHLHDIRRIGRLSDGRCSPDDGDAFDGVPFV
jgi:hypothetical protein